MSADTRKITGEDAMSAAQTYARAYLKPQLEGQPLTKVDIADAVAAGTVAALMFGKARD